MAIETSIATTKWKAWTNPRTKLVSDKYPITKVRAQSTYARILFDGMIQKQSFSLGEKGGDSGADAREFFGGEIAEDCFAGFIKKTFARLAF